MQDHELTHEQIFEKYVGSVTPKEFIAPYNKFKFPIEEAIQTFMKNYPHETPPPNYLANVLYSYLTSQT